MAIDNVARSIAIKALKSGGGSGDVSKEYVDTELTKKVDKVTSTSANPRVYGVDEQGTQTTYFATQTPNASTIPLRDASGRFQVEDGIAPKQAVNKAQLDAVAQSLDLNIENGTGAKSLQQKQDGTSGTFDFTGKNPNATALDPTLTGNIPYGGVGDFATAFGGKSSAQGKRSFAAGTTIIAKGAYSAAFGDNSVALGGDSFVEGYANVSSGKASHAEGTSTQALGEASHSEGSNTIANNTAAHAEGEMTQAYGYASHVEGYANKTLKERPSSGDGDVPVTPTPGGSWNIEEHYGVATHAEGYGNIAYGFASHVEGHQNVAQGHYSHAGGLKNTASGESSFTHGYNNAVSGQNSSAVGASNNVSGDQSFAAGLNNTVAKDNSAAIGSNLTITKNNETVIVGLYNNEDAYRGTQVPRFVVGTGILGGKANGLVVYESGRVSVATAPLFEDEVVRKLELDECAKLSEQNKFTELNTFTQTTQFDQGLESDGNITVTNSVFKVLDNSANSDGTNKDYVAQYNADKITLEENGSNYELQFPKKSGVIATLSDVTGGVDFKHSELVNLDTADSKEDAWKITDDDASATLYHENGTSKTGIAVSKNYIRLSAQETNNGDTADASIAFNSDAITIAVSDTGATASTTLSINENGVKLNGKDLVTSESLDSKLNVLESSAVNQVYARTEAGVDEGITFSYAAEGNTIAKRSNAGTLAVETPSQENDAANKKYVDNKCSDIPVGVVISDIAGSVAGLVAEDDFVKLTSNPNNYILKDGKKYDRSSERTTADSLSYVYNGYLNNDHYQEVIEITVSAKSWVLKSGILLTTTTYANGKVGGVSVKSDFTDGLEVSQTNGNLSIYRAVDEDIANRASKRPITPTNLNKAVLAALTDTEHITPDGDQQATFKAAWGITASMFEGGVEVYDLTEISVNATNEATSGTIKDDYWTNITDDKIICLKLNNEYYYTSDDGHTPGVKSFTHTGWNGNANQTKSINVTLETKAWALTVGYSKYYMHYITLTTGSQSGGDLKTFYYNFPSPYDAKYTIDTLPVQPDTSITPFVLMMNTYYSNVNGLLYKVSDNSPLKLIVHGVYTTDGTSFSYLSMQGTEIATVTDEVVDI